MPSAGVVVTGDRELDQMLATITNKKVKPALRKAAREAAKVTANQAKANVPKDTGALRKSIKVRALRRSRKNKGIVGVRVVTGEHLFKGEQYYGAFVEFGTSRMRPRPFLRPAINQSKGRANQAFRMRLREAIQAAGR